MLNVDHFMSLRARQSRARQSLCLKDLRLLRPKGLAMTKKRNVAPVNGYNFSYLTAQHQSGLIRRDKSTLRARMCIEMEKKNRGI